MTFDIVQINNEKKTYRQKLSRLPFGDKLKILDQMRARDLWIRSAQVSKTTGTIPHPPSKSDP